ncbi:Rab43 protein [Polychytrium aggregatum]|uniref:Rab43 protein n=1 Tax=Polychytrium aggregatum TaxID=110093 RepID=UPI0022FED51D|nr:Rab43 protein [Polychytrium aggregatum]KAI9204524.1 Rab43 protein [Polychytrium aggregatum]
MARNEEKAQSMLYRFREAQEAELGIKKQKQRRPYLASECDDASEAQKWRYQIIGEISKKVSKIQDTGLTEFQIRDLNDEINKLFREKRHWENRIVELGGPDYRKSAPKITDDEGREVPGSRGYRYFGRAKDLPGVKELFEAPAGRQSARSRFEMYKCVDADYYGYRDEDDGKLLAYEKHAQKNIDQSEQEIDVNTASQVPVSTEGPGAFLQFGGLAIPSQKEVEEWLVRRKRQELVERYLDDKNTLSAQQSS